MNYTNPRRNAPREIIRTDNVRMVHWRHNRKINQWIKEACEANGMPELTSQIKWEFNSRFTRRMGDAQPGTKHIRLSAPLWERADEDEQRNTVKHEVCHLIAPRLLAMVGKREDAHGAMWRACMRVAGEHASRCHNVNTDGLKVGRKKYKARCSCRTLEIGATRRNRMLKKKMTYFCKLCGTSITLI
jgi:predicted SprT family Zn-dependent metalloprotease